MDENMNNLFADIKKMVDSGNLPPELQQMMNNVQNNSNNFSKTKQYSHQDNSHFSKDNSKSTDYSNQNNNSVDINNFLSKIPPDMLNNISSMLNNNSNQNIGDNNSNNKSQNNFNIDMNTILKMKSLMENMNNKNDPRANLLYSLKPYLRDSKKDKIDQYVNMLNITKFTEFMNKSKNDTDKN